MQSSGYLLIKKQLEDILQFLQPLLPIANCHMVDFFTHSVYETFLPEKIRKEIESVGQADVIDLIFSKDLSKFPNLKCFVDTCSKYALKNTDICLNFNSLVEQLKDWGCDEILKLKLDIFMNSKKSHEVEILSAVAAAVRNVAGTSHIIDVGDGKGYLSSMLALHHKVPVLGVDASIINTNGAVARAQKLSKIWNSVVYPDGQKSKETSVHLYKQVTQFVNENVNFQDLVSTVFLKKTEKLSLVGLHTCGNLASTSLRIFSTSNHIRSICNVGCCYHLISENFDNDNKIFQNGFAKNGFPMSQYLSEKNVCIGRAARMIAAQSVERIFDKRELPNISIFYRALFEVLLDSHKLPTKQVGRFRKPSKDFVDYVQRAMAKVELDVHLTELEINELYKKYEDRLNELNLFYLIRCLLSPVIESIILLDRLLFLHEQGHEKAFLVQLFDPVVSPRCYGIIAIK